MHLTNLLLHIGKTQVCVCVSYITLHLVIQQTLLSRATYSKYRDIPLRQVG